MKSSEENASVLQRPSDHFEKVSVLRCLMAWMNAKEEMEMEPQKVLTTWGIPNQQFIAFLNSYLMQATMSKSPVNSSSIHLEIKVAS